jgi:hypothetical protein
MDVLTVGPIKHSYNLNIYFVTKNKTKIEKKIKAKTNKQTNKNQYVRCMI